MAIRLSTSGTQVNAKIKKILKILNPKFIHTISASSSLILPDAQKIMSKIATLFLTAFCSDMPSRSISRRSGLYFTKIPSKPLYRESLALIEAKDYKSAIKKLSLFLEKHEYRMKDTFFAASLTTNSIFWIKLVPTTQSVKLNPSYDKAHNNRGLIYGQLRRFDLATNSFTKAIEINPQLKEAYNNRGVARAATGDKKNAIKDFTKSIELDKSYIEPRLNRSFVLEMEGELNKACEDWKIASRMGSRDAQIWLKAQCNK